MKNYDYYEKKINAGTWMYWETPDGDKEAYNNTMLLLNTLDIKYEEGVPINGGYALYIKLK